MHFEISEGKGGLKHGSRPLLGMDIFWNCPMTGAGHEPKKVSHAYCLLVISSRQSSICMYSFC